MSRLWETVPEAVDGERLDRVVALMANLSRNRASVLIQDGGVWVDGQPATARARRVQTGEELSIDLKPTSREDQPVADSNIAVPVIYEDKSIVVVDKPVGLVVHPGSGNVAGTMVNGLLARFPEIEKVGSAARPGIVHRLDRDTSGLLVVARTQPAYEALVEQLSKRLVRRRYRTLVWGHLAAEEGVVDAPIGRSPRDRTRMAVVSRGRLARTRYQVEKVWDEPQLSFATVTLETGRTHQIRVHFSAIGHPVVGDRIYSENRSDFGLQRQFLHAFALDFCHPLNDSEMNFDSPLPADLANVLKNLSE